MAAVDPPSGAGSHLSAQPGVRAAVASGAAATTPNMRLAMAVICAGVFMSSLDLFIVNLAFPAISHDFHGTTLATLSWVLNAYTIVVAALLVPAGRWADLLGRRRIFVSGLVAFTVGSALCGAAPSVGMLIAARVIQATGAAMLIPASLSVLLAVVPPKDRPKAIGLWAAVGGMAAALGPVAGGVLVEASWRWVFLVNLPVGIAAIVLAPRVLPESRDEHAAGRPDILGAGLLGASIGGLALVLVQAPSWGWTSTRTFTLALVVAAAFAAFVARCASHHAPVIELALLRVRSFSGAFVASILYYAAFGAFVLNTVEFLTGVWHFSPLQAGLAIAPGPLMVLPFARVIAPALGKRMGGPGRVAALGCLVYAGGQLYWLFHMTAHSSYASNLLPAQLIGGAGVGLVIPSLVGAGTMALPSSRFGTGSGIINMGRQIGTVIGVAALVAILDALHPINPIPTFKHGILLIVGLSLGAGLISLLIGRLPVRTQAPSPTAVTSVVAEVPA
jgi:EmrB/QacA subfamily drug resistance transporter